MKRFLVGLLCAFGATSVHATTAGAAFSNVTSGTTTAASGDPQRWSVWGGTVGVHWNRDLARDLGLAIGEPVERVADGPRRDFVRFEVRRSGALEFRIEDGHFRGFDGGSLQARGGYVLELADGRIDLTHFRLVPRAGEPFRLDLVSADGKAWFYIDRLMYDMPGADEQLQIRTMDLRISPALAARLGHPEVANWVIANMELFSDVLRAGTSGAPQGSCNDQTGANCNFAGAPAPGGGTYEADLFMLSFSAQYSRCNGCTGSGGNGDVVFTPSSTLKNNVNAGSIETTISGQGPLGVSSALWAADIPWFEKFSGVYPPYENDQHPYLIWNMYRIDADGSIEQIGRSGVKHAFLTVNSGFECEYGFGHVLGRACEDTYGTSNNDSNWDLGPRSEIIPATNQWGRCGSIYDPDCNGSYNDPGNDSFDQRLIVGESQIDAATHPGSIWLFESWYLAREDINIYNSMATVQTTQNWNGSFWSINGSDYRLGSAIDRWVDPQDPGDDAANTELAVDEGHAKVAVKVTDLGDGTWRYDYAVMNFDFARAVTEGAEPNLRVVGNRGFDRFRVAIAPGATLGPVTFRDGDRDAGNDWATSTAGDAVTWTAPAGNTLDWGTLFSFSVVVDAPPVATDVNLHVAESGTPAAFDVASLAPSTTVPNDVVFANGFEN